MKELFTIDTHDYNPDGRVHVRPSARAIIEKDGRFLVMHSRKYDYYKFPGGGIEAGETPEQALIREVREESGYFVKPETIEEFGRVLRRNRDAKDPDAIFEQQNYYYFCEIGDERVPIMQEDYEIEEGFEAVWVECLFALVRANRHALRSGGDPALIEREMRMFDLADEAARKGNSSVRKHRQSRRSARGNRMIPTGSFRTTPTCLHLSERRLNPYRRRARAVSERINSNSATAALNIRNGFSAGHEGSMTGRPTRQGFAMRI